MSHEHIRDISYMEGIIMKKDGRLIILNKCTECGKLYKEKDEQG